MLSLNPDRLREEVSQVFNIIQSIKERLDNGVPGDELPANDMAEEKFQIQMRTELYLAGHRLLALWDALGQS